MFLEIQQLVVEEPGGPVKTLVSILVERLKTIASRSGIRNVSERLDYDLRKDENKVRTRLRIYSRVSPKKV